MAESVRVPNAKKHAELPNPLSVPPTVIDPYRRTRLPLAAIATGLKTTLKVFFRKPVTYEYPEVRRPIAERYRGRIGLELDLCIGCTLCAQACPNGTCFMVDFKFEKTPEMNAKFPNKKDKMPAVDTARCIYCSLCEEVCPTGAIHMTPEYELSRTRKDQVYLPVLLQKTESEIDAMDPAEVAKMLAEGQRLITANDKVRI
ncbi:MAG: NADH-quinone oxidoreductase subunit I [Euryarchaeota archaeon]|nr:NADH-quinone oxidoreductase subunit I [Euryarchaeota archaeon]